MSVLSFSFDWDPVLINSSEKVEKCLWLYLGVITPYLVSISLDSFSVPAVIKPKIFLASHLPQSKSGILILTLSQYAPQHLLQNPFTPSVLCFLF